MPPFKADVVGSMLRPEAIFAAREKRERGEIDAAALRKIESAAIEDAVALQKAAGLKVCTDGEFHRRHWFLDFLEKIDGVEVKGGLGGEISHRSRRYRILAAAFRGARQDEAFALAVGR